MEPLSTVATDVTKLASALRYTYITCLVSSVGFRMAEVLGNWCQNVCEYRRKYLYEFTKICRI